MIQILVFSRTSKALKGLPSTPLFQLPVRSLDKRKSGGHMKWSNSVSIQDDDTYLSLFNSLRHIGAILRSPCYSWPPPDPLPRPTSLEDSSFKPSKSRNSSPSISTDNYTTKFSSTFMTCDTTQRGQLWKVADFHACNPNKPAPLIVTVTNVDMCEMCSYEDITRTICLVEYKYISSSNEERDSIRSKNP